jgi:hypothetical protein
MWDYMGMDSTALAEYEMNIRLQWNVGNSLERQEKY